MQCDELWIHLQTYEVNLRIVNQELQEKKNAVKNLKEKINLTKQQPLYNDIEMPKFNLKQIESTLKISDKFTLKQIIEYLRLDSFEFTKWIAWVVNKDNVSEVLAYRDWALQRNEALIKFLSKFTKETEKLDRLKWEVI